MKQAWHNLRFVLRTGMKRLRKAMKNLRIFGISAQFRTQHNPNTTLDHDSLSQIPFAR
jgi:hypothetical protein